MHLIIVYPYFSEGHGGLFSWASEFTQTARRLGHKVTVVTGREGSAPEQETRDGVFIRRVPMRRARLFRRLIEYSSFGKASRPVIEALLTEWRDSVVLSITMGGSGLAGLRYVHRISSGPIILEWEMWKRLRLHPWWKMLGIRLDFWLQERLERRILRNAKAFLAHTHALSRAFNKRYSLNIPSHIPCCAVDTSTFLPVNGSEKKKARNALVKYGIPEKGALMLFTGGFSAPKGATVLEQALPLIFEAHPDSTLLIVGPIQYQMKLGKHAKNVVSVGRVNRREMPLFYQAADLFVYPTVYNEAVPTNSMLEAMASGLPVIIGDVLGVNEAFTHMKDSLIVPCYSPAAVVAAADSLLKAPSLRKTLGENARKTALRYSYERVTREILMFIEKLREDGAV